MVLQAGLPLLNFGVIKGKQRETYFAAVRTGMARNQEPMREIFRRVVQASNQRALAGCLATAGGSARSAAFFTPSIAIEESTLVRKAR